MNPSAGPGKMGERGVERCRGTPSPTSTQGGQSLERRREREGRVWEMGGGGDRYKGELSCQCSLEPVFVGARVVRAVIRPQYTTHFLSSWPKPILNL